MPRHLVMESDIPLEVECQSVPRKYFSMKAGITCWDLSSDLREQYKVKTEGFSIIPYFSSTVDSVIGKEVDKANLLGWTLQRSTWQ